eukprot:5275754-Pyramimonas_sp.AAC.1
MFAGRGSRAAKHDAWHVRQGRLVLVSKYFEDPSVRLVNTHVQLGTVIDDHGAMYPELYRRAQTTSKQLSQLRRK